MATNSLPRFNPNLQPIIDEYGLLAADIAALEARQKALRAQILEAAGAGNHAGNLFRIQVTTSERSTLDTKLLRSIIAPELLAKVSKTSSVTSLVCKALPIAAAA